jgi:hypothetical protein
MAWNGACASSCPSGKALCGGSSCVDVNSSDIHCGPSCTPCSGAAPRCVSGSCVACSSASDCPALGSVCNANHTCDCRPPSANNLLASPGFASVPDLSSWAPSAGASWNADDADSCVASGSVKMTFIASPVVDFGHITRCITNVSSNKTYYFGLRYKQSGALYCQLNFYADTACSGSPLAGSAYLQNFGNTSIWISASTSTTSPSGVGSAGVPLSNERGRARLCRPNLSELGGRPVLSQVGPHAGGRRRLWLAPLWPRRDHALH